MTKIKVHSRKAEISPECTNEYKYVPNTQLYKSYTDSLHVAF